MLSERGTPLARSGVEYDISTNKPQVQRAIRCAIIAKFHYTDQTGPGSPTKSAHVVGYELNSTTRTRPDPHGPNGVSPQKKSVRVRAGQVGSVSSPCSGSEASSEESRFE